MKIRAATVPHNPKETAMSATLTEELDFDYKGGSTHVQRSESPTPIPFSADAPNPTESFADSDKR